MMWVGRGYFIWCSCWWCTESTKPSFYSDSKNLMAQRWWHVLTSNPLSQAFITRASIRIMCVSCLLRPPCLSSSTVPTPLIRSFVNCCLFVYTRLFVCRCVCVALRASGTWQTAALFLGRLPLPSRGPHWRALALSSLPPPSLLRLWESSQAWLSWAHWLQPMQQHKTCWTCGLYTAQHPQHHTPLHYPQMAGPLTGNHRHWCSASVSGDSTLPWKAAVRLCRRSPCSCLCSKWILMMCHRLTINCSSYSTPKNPGLDVIFLF